MSIRLISAVFDNRNLGPTERLIMLALADHADDSGRCYPSVQRIAQRTGLSLRAVQINIRKLEAQGFVRVVTSGRRGRANDYFINLNPASAVSDRDSAAARDASCRRCTPASDAPSPPQEIRPPSARDAPQPSSTINSTVRGNPLDGPPDAVPERGVGSG